MHKVVWIKIFIRRNVIICSEKLPLSRGSFHIYIHHIQPSGGVGGYHHLSVLADPVNEGANVGVDAVESGTGAALTPGDNTDEGAVNDEGTTRVTLAGVLATLLEAGADHVLGDAATVGGVAGLAVHDGDGDLLELGGAAAALLEGTPSGDDGLRASGGVGAGRGESDVGDAVALGDGVGELPDGNVVVVGIGIVVGVVDDLGDLGSDAAVGGALLFELANCFFQMLLK